MSSGRRRRKDKDDDGIEKDEKILVLVIVSHVGERERDKCEGSYSEEGCEIHSSRKIVRSIKKEDVMVETWGCEVWMVRERKRKRVI